MVDACKKNNILEKTILFYGGEPLLNFKLIKQVVEYLEKLNESVKFEIVTNGSLITIDIANFFRKRNFLIGVSLDGPKCVNDQNRVFLANNEGTYDVVIPKLKILNKIKCNYGLSITISNQLLTKGDDIINWLKKLQPKGISYNLLHITDAKQEWRNYSKLANNFIIDSYKKLKGSSIVEGSINRKINSYYNGEFKFSNCAAIGLNQVTIKPDGTVCICQGCTKISEYSLENIIDFCFDDMINTKNQIWISKAPIMNPKCLTCSAIFICGGGCFLEAKQLFKNKRELDLPFCLHSKAMLEWLLNTSYDEIGAETYEKIL